MSDEPELTFQQRVDEWVRKISIEIAYEQEKLDELFGPGVFRLGIEITNGKIVKTLTRGPGSGAS